MWKNHWTVEFDEQCDINKITAVGVFHSANTATEDLMMQQMGQSLENLANTAVAKNDTIEQLVKSNKQLTDAVEKLTSDNKKS